MTFSTFLKDPDNRLLLLVLLLLAAVIPAYTWHEDTSGFLTDDAGYLMMADFFSPYFEGNVYVDTLNMLRTRFPPVFPIVIALFGGGSQNMGAAHLATGVTFLLAALLLYVWVRTSLCRPKLALACLVVFALLPETLIYVLELRSEFLYLAFLLATFVALDAADRSERYRHELLLAASVLVGLCILTRVVGVCLLAAFLIHLFINRIPRKHLYAITAVALPACWHVIKAINDYSNMYTDDLARYASYDGLWRLLANDIPLNAWLMLTSWGTNFGAGGDASWFHEAVAAVLLLLALLGFATRIRARQPDAFYVIFYVAVYLVWPHPDHMTRFVYPLVPIGLLYIFVGTRLIAGIGKQAPVSIPLLNAGIVLLMLLLIVPNALSVTTRFMTPVPDHVPDDFRHTRGWLEGRDTQFIRKEVEIKSNVVSLLKRSARHLAENECIYADHRPLVMLYTQRPAIRLPSNLAPGNLRRCEYLFVMNLKAEHTPKYPLDVIEHERLELMDIQHDIKGEQQAYLFRIRR